MTQKIIKIGSSEGVTIPKKQLREMGLKAGDSVNITVEPAEDHPTAHDVEAYKLTQKLIKRHKTALKNLADK